MADADEHWMRRALVLAERAMAAGEVPVGAVLVQGDTLLGEGWNCPISTHDPSAHAEIVALRQAAHRVGNYRLPATSLYVTIEPCTMCVGAMIHARVERLVFGALEPKAGAVCSHLRLLDEGAPFNHRPVWRGEVLAADCGALLSRFFRERRRQTEC